MCVGHVQKGRSRWTGRGNFFKAKITVRMDEVDDFFFYPRGVLFEEMRPVK